MIDGSLDLDVDQTQDLSVHFLDNDGNEVAVEHPECFPLSFDVSDLSVISVVSESHSDDHGDEDGHDDHDHGDEEHCEDFLTEADCGMHSECEWHADDSACEDAA